ncbi:hypothetical protein AGATL06_21850 [Agathobaculum sp. TL06]
MTAVYAIPITAVDPDDSKSRARIAPNRLEWIDRRRGTARIQSFAAMLLLEYAVAQHFPWVVHPLAVSIAEGGKPYLVSEPGIHFSLSHSGDWAVCAISDHPVGVDIEWCDPNRRDIASRFFHKEEIRYLNSLPPYARTDAFYSLWTLKESFVKSTGRGLDLPLRSFCVKLRSNARPQLDCPDMEQPYSLFLPPFSADRSYRLAVCIQQAGAEDPVLHILD